MKFTASQHMQMADLQTVESAPAQSRTSPGSSMTFTPARRASMEFRFQYLTEMARQNPKLLRRLDKAGELDRLVELKTREAHRLYQEILAGGPQPPTMMSRREAEEHVKAIMFEFSDDAEMTEHHRPRANGIPIFWPRAS